MTIPGYFHANSVWPVPMVRAAVWLPPLNQEWKSIDFLLDTGAGTTSLHPIDSVFRADIPLATLTDRTAWPPDPETHAGVGGNAIYHAVEAQYAFLQDDGRWRMLEGTIRIAEPTVGNLTLPSLLGWDVLQEFEIRANWRRKTISLI